MSSEVTDVMGRMCLVNISCKHPMQFSGNTLLAAK